MKKLLYIFILACILPSCIDLDDINPKDRVSGDVYFQTRQDAEDHLNGVYNFTLDKIAIDVFWGTDRSTRFVISRNGLEDDVLRYRPNMTVYKNEYAGGLWQNSYAMMANINLLLEKLPNIPEISFHIEGHPSVNRKKEIEGEARLLRAYLYTNMVQHFGDVPLVLSFPKNSKPQDNKVARTPKGEVWEQIKADLAIAKDNLPWSYPYMKPSANGSLPNKSRATKALAMGMLAKIAMNEKRYDDAIVLINAIIARTDLYGLDARFINVFEDKAGMQFSTESIWEIPNYTGEYATDGGYFWYVSGGYRLATDAAYKLYEGGYTPSDGGIKDVRQVFSIGRDKKITKYMRDGSWDDQDPPNFVLMRLAELYFLKAEALAQLAHANAQQVLDIVNKFRARTADPDYSPGYWDDTVNKWVTLPAPTGVAPKVMADVPNQAALIKLVREEKMRELLFEGILFFDMQRWDSYDGTQTAMTDCSLTTPDKLLFPISERELRYNNKLVQNKGY